LKLGHLFPPALFRCFEFGRQFSPQAGDYLLGEQGDVLDCLPVGHVTDMQVHDELVFEVPVEELDKARHLAKREMEGVAKLDVPIKVEMKLGKNWYEAEPMD